MSRAFANSLPQQWKTGKRALAFAITPGKIVCSVHDLEQHSVVDYRPTVFIGKGGRMGDGGCIVQSRGHDLMSHSGGRLRKDGTGRVIDAFEKVVRVSRVEANLLQGDLGTLMLGGMKALPSLSGSDTPKTPPRPNAIASLLE
jgi:hypothetical protein